MKTKKTKTKKDKPGKSVKDKIMEKKPEHDELYDSDVVFNALHGVNPLHQAIEKHGITPDYLAGKLKAELNANEVKVHFEKGSVITPGEDDEDDSGLRVGGEFKYSKKLTLWKIRQTARMDAQKLLGYYPEEKVQLDVTDKTIQFLDSISGKDRNKLPCDEEDND